MVHHEKVEDYEMSIFLCSQKDIPGPLILRRDGDNLEKYMTEGKVDGRKQHGMSASRCWIRQGRPLAFLYSVKEILEIEFDSNTLRIMKISRSKTIGSLKSLMSSKTDDDEDNKLFKSS